MERDGHVLLQPPLWRAGQLRPPFRYPRYRPPWRYRLTGLPIRGSGARLPTLVELQVHSAIQHLQRGQEQPEPVLSSQRAQSAGIEQQYLCIRAMDGLLMRRLAVTSLIFAAIALASAAVRDAQAAAVVVPPDPSTLDTKQLVSNACSK